MTCQEEACDQAQYWPPPPSPATNLGAVGHCLWHEITQRYDLCPDEVRILSDACREADIIERLEVSAAYAHQHGQDTGHGAAAVTAAPRSPQLAVPS